MSTNFYLEKMCSLEHVHTYHLGKRYSAGPDGLGFIVRVYDPRDKFSPPVYTAEDMMPFVHRLLTDGWRLVNEYHEEVAPEDMWFDRVAVLSTSNNEFC